MSTPAHAAPPSAETRIGILGGTFDPLHNGHLAVARAVRDRLRLARVLLIPACRPPHKLHDPITPFALRAAMIRAAVADDPTLDISLIEAETLGPSFSIDTLKRLAPTLDQQRPYFIIGGDAFSDIPSWKRFRDLTCLANLVVVNRDHESVGKRPEEVIVRYFSEFQAAGEGRWQAPGQGEIILVSMPRVDISSTRVRELVRHGEAIADLVPRAVAAEIARHGLYGWRDSQQVPW